MMHFHWCGNVFHDVPANLLVLVALFPEWVPWSLHVREWAVSRMESKHESI